MTTTPPCGINTCCRNPRPQPVRPRRWHRYKLRWRCRSCHTTTYATAYGYNRHRSILARLRANARKLAN